MHDSDVTSLPLMSMRLTIAGVFSSISQRRSTFGQRIRADLAPLDHRLDARVDVAFVRVGLLHLARRVIPRGLVEDVLRFGRPAADQSLHRLADRLALVRRKGVHARDVLVREPLRAVHLEIADLVLRPLVHGDANERLPLLPIDDQRVLHDRHVDVAVRRVQLGNVFRQILGVLVRIELAVAPPEEALGLGRDPVNDHIGRERLVARDLDARDRQPAAFVDVEGDCRALVADICRVDTHLREVIPLGLVERIDAGDVARDLGRVDRLSDQKIDAIAHRAIRDVIRPFDLHVAEHAALDQVEVQDAPPADHLDARIDVLELVRRIELPNGSRDRPRAYRGLW